MKKFYVLIVVIICSAAQGFSQTWVGPATGGSWNVATNWNPAEIPDGATADVTINTGATPILMTLDANVIVRSLTINGSGSVRIDGSTALNAISLSGINPSLTITSNATLRLFQATVDVTGNATGTISGILELEGSNDDDYGYLTFENAASSTRFTVNGTILDEYGKGVNVNNNQDIVIFGSEAKLRLAGTAPVIFKANYNSTSEIIITGVTVNNVSVEEAVQVGSITYNCPQQSISRSLEILTGFVIAGSLNIENTNNRELRLLRNQLASVTTTPFFTIMGNLNISGNSNVVLSSSDAATKTYSATVNGNFLMSGNSFNIQNSNVSGLKPTTLFVKGNINHTSGTITATSTASASSASLFNIEMNGSGMQAISSSPQSFNNTDNQVALRISNPTGVTLTSPLNVGMLGFSSNGKLITTETNFIKVMNPSNASYVVSGTGFVQGPVRRATNVVAEYIFPTGSGTTARYVSVFPTSTDLTTFEGSFSSLAPTNTTVTSPLTSIVSYYWEVDRISTGTNARVEITLPADAPGGSNSNALVVAKSSGGADWVSTYGAAGSTFLPGDAAAGMKIRSEIQTSFSSFTIGILPMSAALPIDLLSFTVTKSGSKANLNWKVTGSSTPKSFEVMKSDDGINFSKIGTVSGLTAKTSYDFTDNNLLAGNNYYRLKMLDIDGTVSYSNIIVAMNGTSGTLITSMIPTMVADRARVNISSASKGNMQLVITDINGRIIQTQNASINAGNQEIWINATKLATGYFQITGYINGEKTATIRFFKR